MNCLDLYSGTGSVGKVCKELGWNVVSVDLELPATHECDIMDFDYKQYPKDYFSVVWASPPCVAYSRLQECFMNRMRKGVIYTREIQEKERIEADKLVMKSLEIINYFNPEAWFMENPQSGNLKHREIVKGIPFYDVDYCMYSDWGYKKRTRIWTNIKDWDNKLCDKECGSIVDGKHTVRMGTSKSVEDNGKIIRVNTAALRQKYKNHENINKIVNTETTKLDRYRVPPDLIYSLFLD